MRMASVDQDFTVLVGLTRHHSAAVILIGWYLRTRPDALAFRRDQKERCSKALDVWDFRSTESAAEVSAAPGEGFRVPALGLRLPASTSRAAFDFSRSLPPAALPPIYFPIREPYVHFTGFRGTAVPRRDPDEARVRKESDESLANLVIWH